MTAFPPRREEWDPESRPGGALKDGTILLQGSSAAHAAVVGVSAWRREASQTVSLLSDKKTEPRFFARAVLPGVAPALDCQGRLGASRLPCAALRRFAVLTRPARSLNVAITGASPSLNLVSRVSL